MIKRLLLLVVTGSIAAIVLGLFGFIHPALDSIANFRWHFSIVLLLLGLLWFFLYDWQVSILLVLIALGGWLSCLMPFSQSYIQPSSQFASRPHQQEFSLLHLNLYYANPAPQKVLELIKRTAPDILTLSELSKNWQQRLKVLDKDYPFSYRCPEWTVIGGSVIYSRLPMTSDKGYCHNYAALALKDIIIENKTITIGSVHLRWPWPASGPRQVDELEPVLRSLGPDALIGGDFNSTTWTWLLRRFAGYGNLQIVKYTGASWMYRRLPTSLAKWFGLSIDNAMAKGSVKIISAKVLDPVGSDHLPLLVRFYVD